MTALSVLDLVHVREGSTPAEALRDSLDLARHAERHGYRRYWVSEHHNMPGIAGAATAVVLAHLAGYRGGTKGLLSRTQGALVAA